MKETQKGVSVYKFELVLVKGAAFAFAVASASASWQADCIIPEFARHKYALLHASVLYGDAKKTAGGSRELERSGHQIARHSEGAIPMNVGHLEVRSLLLLLTRNDLIGHRKP